MRRKLQKIVKKKVRTKRPPPRAARPSAPRADESRRRVAARERTTIVGVGASAGGLEAFSQLLHALPPNPGLALVLVQHLAPQHESALPSLLAAKTKLPVVQAEQGMRVEPNHVYVIPPNVQMGIDGDVLRLLPRPHDRSQYMPIDFFLRALAESAEGRAIGVILSGTASDGAVGVREIKAVGGITLAQEPETAKYDGMPRAAIATGMVDLVLPLERLAHELAAIARHPYVQRARPAADETALADDVALRDEQLQRVFALLRAASGVDFKHYKLPTIERRLQRRMVLHKLTRFDQYLTHLQQNPGEVQALYQDLLIHVTRFFREPESFAVLAAEIYPQLIAAQRDDHPIRVWIAGCSTGEEAYSVAITLLESLGDRAGSVPIQIFATDVSENAIDHARTGIYPGSIAADVSPERLRRFFTKIDGSYRVSKSVRDLCIFARQDLSRDPPFSKLDLVVCRNVLIYMTAALQRKLLTVFHYALKPHGCVMLGHAETVGTLSDSFTVEDKRHRIYKKKLLDEGPRSAGYPMEYSAAPAAHRKPPEDRLTGVASIQNEANRLVLDRYAPPGVVVDESLQIVQFRGQTGLFLEPAPGDPSINLLKMAREGLLYGLRTAINTARKSGAVVAKDGMKVRRDGGWVDVAVEVFPLGAGGRGHFLVLFHSGAPSTATPSSASKRLTKRGAQLRRDDDRIRRLQEELAASREYLQSIIQEVEAANEELQSANEEILSSNEELQSTNEELDTAKEELQSTNEELNTVNEELHGRNEELSSVNSDLVNLLGSVQIAIVIVAGDLRIRRFTPMAERVLNLIGTDVGRPISHLKPNIDCPDLEKMIGAAMDTVLPQERDVQDRQGNWYSLRIRPYKNVENRIDGAVLALFDIQTIKQQDAELRKARAYADLLFESVPLPLVALDESLRVTQANAAFCGSFRYQHAAIEGRSFFGIDKGAWKVPALQTKLATVLKDGERLEEIGVTRRFPRVGTKSLLLSARGFRGNGGSHPSLLLALREVGRGTKGS